jgi:hypothetical protein
VMERMKEGPTVARKGGKEERLDGWRMEEA